MSTTAQALIMAGGTGGHIFPGLAVAQGLKAQGWRVHWLGGEAPSMESDLVPKAGFEYHSLNFKGVRGKGLMRMITAPFAVIKALAHSIQIIRAVRPQVVLGFGGYISLPGGLASVLCRVPLVLHEQNAKAGMANVFLSKLTRLCFTAFPNALQGGQWIGNPMRHAFIGVATPKARYAAKRGAIKVLVVGGSLGAKALNEIVPKALALIPEHMRPVVVHQSGAKQIEALQGHYKEAGVQAQLVPFIEDMASALSEVDVVISRAGASTVTEIAAIGVASLLVPFPFAVDDHQTANANFLVEQSAAWLCQQKDLTPEWLAQWLVGLTREQLSEVAAKAHALKNIEAVERLCQVCQMQLEPQA